MHIPGCIRPSIALIALTALLTASSAHAISSRTLLTFTGEAESDEFGYSVATAGDVNGDGFADLIVGASQNDAGGSRAGRAYVYYGGPGADATADLTLTGAAANDRFGFSVGTAGDVNGDGYADLIVGAYQNSSGGLSAGRAYVYYGGPGADAAADLTLTGAAPSDLFGYSVATAGDVNGDGYADVFVGAILNGTGGVGAGQAYVYYGGPAADATADLTITGEGADDQFGISVGTAGDVNGDGYADLIVGAYQNDAGGADAGRAYVYHGGPGADATADLTLTGAATINLFGNSVRTAGDVNGDGYADVIVGAHLNDAGGIDAGRAYVYYGGPAADANADLTLTGTTGEAFGASVGTAGDVNGDGHSDVIVGAYLNSAGGPSAGRAYLYHGGPAVDAAADLTLTGTGNEGYGNSVGTAGDVDGDGYSDLIIGAPFNNAGGINAGRAYVTSVYPYQVISPNGNEQWVAGTPVTVRWRGHDPADLALSTDGGATWSPLASGVGGLDENEHTVIAAALPTSFARVRLSYAGQPVSRSTSDASDGVFRIVLPVAPPAAASRLQRSLTGAAAGDFFGISAETAGDVNGDGYADWIVGAYQNDAAGLNAGRAYVYHGGPGADAIADLTFTGAAAGDNFGISVGTAGDVNGDGFADLIVGANQNDAGGADAGRAYVYFGGPAADATADLTLTGAAAGDLLGISVGTAGDVNGDGYGDLIVGAHGEDTGGPIAGRAYVYHGGLAPNATADLTLTGAASADFFGTSVGTAGDVNGDGYSDLIVGAYQNDAGGTNAGRAYVYFGGPGANATADLTLTGEAAGDNFGYSVDTAGDVNGDGYADLIAGASQNDAGGIGAGRAYVYHGGPAADATADLTLTGAAAGDNFGFSAATAGDVNGDGYADLVIGANSNDAGGTSAGRAYVYYGRPGADANPDLILTGAAVNDNFGISVATAGDVNGDGYADLIIGAPLNDAGGIDAGRAYVYDHNRYFVTAPNGGETWNVGAMQTISWRGAEPADLWLSVDGGGSFERIRSDVGGSETNSIPIQVPHLPTRFAKVQITPAGAAPGGMDQSESLFTIQASVALLAFAVEPAPEGGALLTWSTDPGIGPEGLAGYRLYRLAPGIPEGGTLIGPDLILEPRYLDPAAAGGSSYRLAAVNGLREELELGRTTLAPQTALAAWPLPYRHGELMVSFAVSGRLGATSGSAEVGLYDVSGRLVRMLARGDFMESQIVRWDGRDMRGEPVGNGLYFLRARSGGEETRLKVVVAR